MVPLPKRKLSRARQGKRRKALKLALKGFSLCPSCNQPKLSHRICPQCGYYNEEKRLTLKSKKEKKRNA